jgi:bisanhydrobacterioruberin hydratase
MLIYDVLLEQVALSMNMWSWQNNRIPLQNYIAWFVIAVIMQGIFHACRVNTKNKIALFLFGVQITFFFTLALYFNLIN